MRERIEFAQLFWLQPTWQQLAVQIQGSRLHHALLLTGAKGIGKQRLSIELAKRLLCQQPTEQSTACLRCKNCQLFEAGSHPDFTFISPNEKGSIPIDVIRDATQRALRSAHQGGARVILLDQAHCMNPNAANALLKTLEEPPANVFLLLASDSPQLLLPTITSRCQVMPLATPEDKQVEAWLQQQGVKVSKAFLNASQLGPLQILEAVTNGRQDAFMSVVKGFVASMVNGEVEDQLVKLIEQDPEPALAWCQHMLMTMCQTPEKLQTQSLKERLISLAPMQRASLLHRTSSELMDLRRCLIHSGVNRTLQIQSSLIRVIKDVVANESSQSV